MRTILLLEALKVICTSSPGTKADGYCQGTFQVDCFLSSIPDQRSVPVDTDSVDTDVVHTDVNVDTDTAAWAV